MPTVNKQLDLFWNGKFGDHYIGRNEPNLQARIDLWSEILGFMTRPRSILEVGCNIGQNLQAIQALCPRVTTFAVEPNAQARQNIVEAGIIGPDSVRDSWAHCIDFPERKAELVFTSGLLIHIRPELLQLVCSELYRLSSRYIVLIEYFSADPEMKVYRGEADRLWKRDFGSFMLKNFRVKPLGCGFAWKEMTGLDNLTFWVFEKC